MISLTSDEPLVSQLKADESWILQGRVIPPSCSEGNGTVLHLQTRRESWAEKHFHIGRIPISPEAGLEFVSTLVMPPSLELLRDSFDPSEREHDLEYLAMTRLTFPKDAIAFITVTGLAIVVKAEDLDTLFTATDKCKDCVSSALSLTQAPSMVGLTDEAGNFDLLMEMTGETFH